MTANDLIAAFDVVADAPDGVKRLRELVLQLAVRGKLVPQDLGDEPAQELLRRVVSERSAAGGRASKGGSVAPNDIPFEVPTTWAWVRFGDIFECRLGKMLDKAKNRGSLHPYLRNANVRWGAFDLSDVLHMRLEEHEVPDVSVRKGDLVICEGGEPGRSAVWESEAPFVIQKALHRARPYLVDSRYYQVHLRVDCASGRIAELFTGATIMHFTGQVLDRHTVTLPPLAEQHRIVARVDELMGLLDRLEAARTARDDVRRAARDAALAALRDAEDTDAVEAAWGRIAGQMAALFAEPEDVGPLRQAVLGLAVRGRLVPQQQMEEPASAAVGRARRELAGQPSVRGRPATTERLRGDAALSVGPWGQRHVPKGWVEVPLALVTRLESGHTPDRDVASYWDGDVPWVGIQDARRNRGKTITATEKRVTQAGIDNSAARRLPAGTVCLSRTASVGYTVVLGAEMCTSQDFVNFVCSSGVLPRYLQVILEAEYKALKRFAKGAVHLTIYFPEVKAFEIILPPLAEQHRIVAKVDALMAFCDALEARLSNARNLHGQFAAAAAHNFDR